MTLIAGEERFIADAGAFVYIPADTVHTYRIESSHADLLNWYLPGGFEQVLQETGVPAPVRTLPTSKHIGAKSFSSVLEQTGTTILAIPDVLREEPE